MKVYIIGIGMGAADCMTKAAAAKIEEADVLIGAGRLVDAAKKTEKERFISYKGEEIAEFLRGKSYGSAAVLLSGDTGFYSAAKKIAEHLGEYKTEIIPGVSSLAYFCARLGISYEDVNVVSLHGRGGDIVGAVRRHKRVFVLLGDNPCARLAEYGFGDTKIYIGDRLSYEDEKITRGQVKDFIGYEFNAPAVMLIENENYDNRVRIGIPDVEFIRGDVPMTKRDIRAAAVSRLCIAPGDICWDIGAGTGSVSVETALLCHGGAVYAVEKNADACGLIEKNAKKFKVGNIHIISGEAPDRLDALPAPDKVFIGGSSGNIDGIIRAVFCKNKNAEIVVTAVSLGTLTGVIQSLDRLGAEYDISQIFSASAKTVGTHKMMSANNPVFIIHIKGH